MQQGIAHRSKLNYLKIWLIGPTIPILQNLINESFDDN
jgi:hypothetical protein